MVDPITVEWDGNGSVQAYVISKNLHRRHLNVSQLALIGAKLATRPLGDQGGVEISTPSTQEVADLLNIDRHTVQSGKTVLREGIPEEIEAVETGKAAVSVTTKGTVSV